MRMAELLKPGDVARLLNVSSSTVRRWIAEGHLAAIKTPGGQYRIHPDVAQALVANPPQEASAAA